MVGVSMLIGFGFGNLAMLGWLAAAAAPLLIHLWSRQRYRETPWAAMSFLLAAVRKHSRRIQLEQWLLLAVRTLLVALVVLAVAEPYAGQWGAGLAGAPTHRVLVVDTSFSMIYRDGDTTRLAMAKELAAAMAKASGPADAFTLIAMAHAPRELVGRDIADRRIAAERIDALVATQTPANLAATLGLVDTATTLTPLDAQRFERQEVHFFTDLQRSTWAAAESDEARAKFAALAVRAAVHIIDVGAPDAANLAVTELGADGPFVTVGRPAKFVATLREFGSQPRSGCRVELLIDGTPVGEQTVDVAAGGEATVQFPHQFRAAGGHAVAVRATGDRLELDNTRWLAVPVKERVRVLAVGGSAADTRYLADALNPDRSKDASILVTTITEGELAETEFAPFECILLSNVAQLAADETARLAAYVRQGGGLVVFLGDRVVAESYNRANNGDSPLLPARLGDVLHETRFGLDPLEYKHPIVAPFRGRERAGLLSTPVERYFRLHHGEKAPSPNPLPAGEGYSVALALPGGDPLVVAAPIGQGRVVLVATAGSMASVDATTGEPWTTWPAWPSFLPIVRGILAYAVSGQERAWQVAIGEPILLPSREFANVEGLSIERPDGRRGALRPMETARDGDLAYSDTDVSGIYSLRGAGDEATFFAVNLDTRESDLATIDHELLPKEASVGGEASDIDSAGSGWQRAGWQGSLLWTAFALALVELGLAWRFGRGNA